MGFQDRGYLRQRQAPFMADWTGVMLVIVLNVSLWLLNFVLDSGLLPFRRSLDELFCLRADGNRGLLEVWRLLTYGFLHDPQSPWHLLFNMLGIWFFGREIEALMGRAEFLRFYCTAIVLAGLAWVASVRLAGGDGAPLIGASGGVMAVLAVFIWYFPTQTVLIYGVLPVPAWALGLLLFFGDVSGATDKESHVAHVAHLAGAAFGILYAWQRWDLSGLTGLPGRLVGPLFDRLFSRRTRMRVVRPDDDDGDDGPSLEVEVDRILAKISRSGESSLTPEERRTLTRASRRFRDREGSR